MKYYLDDGINVTEAEAEEKLHMARHVYGDTALVHAACGHPEMRQKWQNQLNRLYARIRYWEAKVEHCRNAAPAVAAT